MSLKSVPESFVGGKAEKGVGGVMVAGVGGAFGPAWLKSLVALRDLV